MAAELDIFPFAIEHGRFDWPNGERCFALRFIDDQGQVVKVLFRPAARPMLQQALQQIMHDPHYDTDGQPH